MTPTAYLLIFAIALIAMILVIITTQISRNKLKEAYEHIDDVIEGIQRHKKHAADKDGIFAVVTSTTGEVSVEKVTMRHGHFMTTVIKVFNDPDEEFNYREADELATALNAK